MLDVMRICYVCLHKERLKTFLYWTSLLSICCLFALAIAPLNKAGVYIACIATEQWCVANVAPYTDREPESLFTLWLTWW